MHKEIQLSALFTSKKAVVGDPPPAQLRVTIEANPDDAV
jgi:hypothetical protein